MLHVRFHDGLNAAVGDLLGDRDKLADETRNGAGGDALSGGSEGVRRDAGAAVAVSGDDDYVVEGR